MVTHYDSWLVIMTNGESSGILVTHCESWWLIMTNGDSLWLMVTQNNSSWVIMNPGDSSWIMMTHYESWWLTLTPGWPSWFIFGVMYWLRNWNCLRKIVWLIVMTSYASISHHISLHGDMNHFPHYVTITLWLRNILWVIFMT